MFFFHVKLLKEGSNSTFDILDFSPNHGFQRSERREYWMKGVFRDWLTIPTIHRVSEQISSEVARSRVPSTFMHQQKHFFITFRIFLSFLVIGLRLNTLMF